METKTIWLDGKLVVHTEATCAISCASLMDGMVVLEDAPLFKNERGSFVFRVDDHVKQFERSAENRAHRTAAHLGQARKSRS